MPRRTGTDRAKMAGRSAVRAALAADQQQRASGTYRVAPPDGLLLPTREEIELADRGRLGPPDWRHLDLVFPDLVQGSPERTLEAAMERFVASPGDDNAVVLQMAMNRLSSSEARRDRHTEALLAAKHLLSGDGEVSPDASDNIFFEAYEHADFGGHSFFTSMTPGWAYWRVPDFRAVNLVYTQRRANDLFSSVELGASTHEVGGQVVFFEHIHYDGRYLNVAVRPEWPNNTQKIPFLGHAFNDITSSALIVRRFANETEPVPIGRLVNRQAIVDTVNRTWRVEASGDPVLTWDLWPTGNRNAGVHPHDPDRTFIHVEIPVTINWPTAYYAAQIHYWIYLYVSNGRIQGHVAHWGYWVEGGFYTQNIVDRLKNSIPEKIGDIDAMVRAGLNLANLNSPYRFTYYLPGRNDYTGHVRDDVSVVAVR